MVRSITTATAMNATADSLLQSASSSAEAANGVRRW